MLLFYGVFLITDWLAAMLAFLMEPGRGEGDCQWLIMLQRFAYRQIMYSVVLKSFFAAFRGRAWLAGVCSSERRRSNCRYSGSP